MRMVTDAELEGFRIVGDGAFHLKYCNGIEHIWVGGNHSSLNPREFMRRARCGCPPRVKATV